MKDKFYDDLGNIISATPRKDKLILLGDLNARFCTDHQTWEGVIGSEGVGKSNNNGFLLLRKNDSVVSMHVEEGGYPTRLQGCFHNPPLQTERKSSSL